MKDTRANIFDCETAKTRRTNDQLEAAQLLLSVQCEQFVLNIFLKMMLNLPILGVVCEPKLAKVKKFEYFSNGNVNFD